MSVTRNRIRFIEIAIHPRQNASNIPTDETAPFLLKRQVLDRKFVIAVADGGFLRRLCSPHNLVRYGRPLKSQVKHPGNRPARYFVENKAVPVSFGCDLLAPRGNA